MITAQIENETTTRTEYDCLDENHKLPILRIEKGIRDKLDSIKKDFIEIGKFLSEAKKFLEFGNYKLWIEQTFGDELPYSTAHSYKRIYEELVMKEIAEPDGGNIIRKFIMTFPVYFLMDMTHKNFPDSVKEWIYGNRREFSYCNIRKISNTFKDYNSGKISLKEFKKQTIDELKAGRSRIDKNENETNEERMRKRKKIVLLRNAINCAKNNLWKVRRHFGEVNLSGLLNIDIKNKLLEDVENEIKYLQKLKVDIQKAETLKI